MKRIFIIEDDDALRDMLHTVIESEGFEVTVYNSPSHLIENAYNPPDLFIVDIEMPHMDGLTFCGILKTADVISVIPVIIMSARVDFEAAAFSAGASAVLQKPFDINVLFTIIKQLTAVPRYEIYKKSED